MQIKPNALDLSGLPLEAIRAVKVFVLKLRRGIPPGEGHSSGGPTGVDFVDQAQEQVKRYATPGRSIVDEFIEERRKEAKRE